VASILQGDETLPWGLLEQIVGTQAIGLASAEETQQPHVELLSIHHPTNVHDTIGLSLPNNSGTPTVANTKKL
jgi:hypothetical protein